MLNADDLMEQAVRQTGLSDYGNYPLAEGLAIFCRSLNDEAKLTEKGVAAATAEILDTLVQRLQIEDYYRQHPETDQQQVVAPLMVTGLPRGGTTALSQMLSKDPALRSIKRWEANWPCPPSSPATAATDRRVQMIQDSLEARLKVTPEYRTQLQVEANDPTEHYCFLRLTFQSHHWAGFYDTPSYGDWVLSCEMEPSYRYMKRVLKLLQVNYPAQRWNLKHPQDLYQLDAMAAVFPDAIFVWNHRDPFKTVPSVASLIVTLRRPNTDEIDKHAIGRSELERCALLVERGMKYRAQPDAKTFADTFNRDIIRDAAGTIRQLYEQIGLEYTDAFDASLTQRNTDLPKGKYGAHVYTAEDFGLDRKMIDDRFAFYTSAYGLKEPSPA